MPELQKNNLKIDDRQLFVLNKEVQKEIQSLKANLTKKGMKWTNQRMELATWVFNNHNHFTVDDIVSSFKRNNKPMPVATAYRFIQSLLDLQLVVEHNIGESSKYYEHVLGHSHHDHIVCTACSRIVEFTDEKIEALQESIARKHGFQLQKHTMILYGLCPDCIKNKSRIQD